MRSFTIAVCLSAFALIAHAEAAETDGSWSCRGGGNGVVCESALSMLVPVNGMALGTETGFSVLDELVCGLHGADGPVSTDVDPATLDLVPVEDIAAGTETGFRCFMLVEWTCVVEMAPGVSNAKSRCSAPQTHVLATYR